MKCPKCGYTSFESNDTCKKCSHDLTAHREVYGLKPVVFQMERRAAMAAAMVTETVSTVAPQQPAEQPTDMFSFDIPDHKPVSPLEETSQNVLFSFDDNLTAPPSPAPSPFSFDEVQAPAKPIPQEEAFADLLEPTHLGEPTPSVATAATSSPPLSGDAPGEYDLSNFSWDDTPVEPSGTTTKKADDDFTSLFGEIDDPATKKQS